MTKLNSRPTGIGTSAARIFDRTESAQPEETDAPPIWCPFPVRIHPDTEGLDDDLVAWAQTFGLIRSPEHEQQIRHAGFGAFAARVHPDALHLRLVAQWYLFAWLLDDPLDEEDMASSKEAAIRIATELKDQFRIDFLLPSPPVHPSPLASAWSDLWRRTAPTMSLEWRARFLSHYRDYLAVTVRDVQYYQNRPPELGNYLRRRRINSGGQAALDLIEVASLDELHPDFVNSDLYRSTRTAAIDVMSWTNDIFSFPREAAHGDNDNLVAILKTSQSLTWSQAVQAAVVMTETETKDFIRSCEDLQDACIFYDLPPHAWRTATKNLHAVAEWLAGNLDWHRRSDRYRIDNATEDR